MASLLKTGVILGNGGEKFTPMAWYRACTGTSITKKSHVYSKVNCLLVMGRVKKYINKCISSIRIILALILLSFYIRFVTRKNH